MTNYFDIIRNHIKNDIITWNIIIGLVMINNQC